ncbi:MAG: MFS transporter [Deltaproteobacteria bacterium]|nr:MFS transporter [Deltaproteobacteria bacterium]
MRNIYGLHPTVIFLGLASLFNDLASEIIYPLLPLFLTNYLGASVSFLGLVEGIAETTSSILKLYSGYISDKIGKRRFLTAAGYIISNIVRPLMGSVTSPLSVLILRFTDRVGKGIRTSPRDAIIASVTDTHNRGKAFGFHRSMDNLGALLGSFVGFVLLSLFGLDIRTIFILVLIPGVLTIVSVLLGIRSAAREVGGNNKELTLTLKPFDKNFRRYLLVVAIFTLGNSSDAFLLLKAKECGFSDKYIPLLWMILSIVRTLFSVPAGMISDKINRKKVIIFGWVVYAASYIGFAYSEKIWHIWVLFCIYGFYYALTEGVEKAFVADLVREELRGTAYGMYNFIVGILALPSSLLCGLLWQHHGPVYALGLGALLSLFSSVLLVSVKNAKDKS